MTTTFKTPETAHWFGFLANHVLLWFGAGGTELCCPPAEVLKGHGDFMVLLAGGQVVLYHHLDSKKNTWEFPLEQHIVGWLPFFQSCHEDNVALQRFLLNTTPASQEPLDLQDIKLLNGSMMFSVRSAFGVTTFIQPLN